MPLQAVRRTDCQWGCGRAAKAEAWAMPVQVEARWRTIGTECG